MSLLLGKQGEYVVDYSIVNQVLAPIPWGRMEWCPCRDSNSGTRFRKPMLYPPELQGRAVYEAVPSLLVPGT